jgi:hypothetical protein
LNFGDGCPVLACHPGNYKPAALGFGAQRGGRQSKLRGDRGEAQRLVVVDGDLDVGVRCFEHLLYQRRLAQLRKRNLRSGLKNMATHVLPYGCGARIAMRGQGRLLSLAGVIPFGGPRDAVLRLPCEPKRASEMEMPAPD